MRRPDPPPLAPTTRDVHAGRMGLRRCKTASACCAWGNKKDLNQSVGRPHGQFRTDGGCRSGRSYCAKSRLKRTCYRISIAKIYITAIRFWTTQMRRLPRMAPGLGAAPQNPTKTVGAKADPAPARTAQMPGRSDGVLGASWPVPGRPNTPRRKIDARRTGFHPFHHIPRYENHKRVSPPSWA